MRQVIRSIAVEIWTPRSNAYDAVSVENLKLIDASKTESKTRKAVVYCNARRHLMDYENSQLAKKSKVVRQSKRDHDWCFLSSLSDVDKDFGERCIM